jgi:large subunit ribosomal protein L24
MAAKIKKGDQVIVTKGRDKGKKGEVTRMLPDDGKAIVQGVNVVQRHRRPTQTDPGGIVPLEKPIQLANIALVDPKSGEATRVGFKIQDDGTKVRVAKKSGEVIDG